MLQDECQVQLDATPGDADSDEALMMMMTVKRLFNMNNIC
jgi:hypothetical protein